MPAPAYSSPSDATCCLLVTGASGNLGQRVLRHLLDTLGVPPCRLVAGSRTPEHLYPFAKRGVLTRYLDFGDPSSVMDAAQCVDRVLLISTPDDPDRVALQTSAVLALAAVGVKHIVYTSFFNVENATALGVHDHYETEQCIRTVVTTSNSHRNLLAGFTFLRNSLYYDNHAVWIAGTSHCSGAWVTAAQHGRLAGLARDDAALAAATALVQTANDAKEVFELASTEGLTIDEVVATIAKAVGKRIACVHISEDSLVDSMVGVRPIVARKFASLDTHVAAGLATPRGNDFKKLTGRDPMTHAQWVERNRAELLRVV